MGHEYGDTQANGSRRTLCARKFVSSSLSPFLTLQPPDRDTSVCIAGIVRIPLLAELKLSDITWTSISVGVWVNVECNIGILSACLPILRPLFSTKYSSSPVSYVTRIVRTITNSTYFTASNSGSSSTDPEKGAVGSEPSSDATMIEGLRWPNDDGTRNWRWSRNNSESTAVPQPRPIAPGSGRPQTEKERERKYRTWYSAAADILPEMDLARQRGDGLEIDAAKIPRYRDDDISGEKKPLPAFPTNDEVEEEVEAVKTERGEGKVEVWQQRHSDALRGSSRSGKSSARSSWGVRRDTWNLMPSVVYWDRGGLLTGTMHSR